MQNKQTFSLAIFILTLGFYIYTLAPSLAWGDGTKLQGDAVAGESFILAEMPKEKFDPDPYIYSKVGVAAWDHPLYIILGNLLVGAFPLMDPLWLVNFVSALFGAASIVLVFHFCFRHTKSLIASAFASLSLAVSHTFWWHSSSPEVYTLFAFLLLMSLYLYECFEDTGKNSFLGYSAFFLGLAASNHLMAFLALIALTFYFFLSGGFRQLSVTGLRNLLTPISGFIAGYIVYIIQFIRVWRSIPLNGLLGPVIGTAFVSNLKLTPVSLGVSLLSYFFFLITQFGAPGVFFGVFGIRQIFRSTDVRVRKIAAFWVVYTIFGIFYMVTDQFAFFLSSHVFWAVFIGIGSDHTLGSLPPRKRILPWGILTALLVATPFFYNAAPNLLENNGIADDTIGIPTVGVGVRDGLAYYLNPYKRGDYSAYNFGYNTVSSLEPNSVVIAEWYTDTDEYFVLRYFSRVRSIRSDISIFGWPTQDPATFKNQDVLTVIEDLLPYRPVYLASLSDRFYAASNLVEVYCIVPENNLYRVYLKSDSELQCLGEDSVTR